MNGWVKGLINAIVSGAATAGSSWMALLAAREAGLTVPTLNLKALGVIVVMGGLTNLFSYLRQSPLFQTSVTTTTKVETVKSEEGKTE